MKIKNAKTMYKKKIREIFLIIHKLRIFRTNIFNIVNFLFRKICLHIKNNYCCRLLSIYGNPNDLFKILCNLLKYNNLFIIRYIFILIEKSKKVSLFIGIKTTVLDFSEYKLFFSFIY